MNDAAPGGSLRRARNRRIAARPKADGAPSAVVAEYWLAGRERERGRVALLAAAHDEAIHKATTPGQPS